MAATGASCLELDTPVNLRRAIKLVGKKVCLQGNIDTTAFLIGRPKDIFQQANKCLEDVRAAKGSLTGFILSSGCEIPYRAKAENIKALVAAGRKNLKKEFL
jgi:uroporphyrinogen decarboxylase